MSSERAELAYIHILEAENVRLKKKNEMLARTSNYQYWTDEGVFHLKFPERHLSAKGPYTTKIVLCMEEGEGDWVYGDIEKFICTHATPRLSDDDLCLMDISSMDLTVYDDTGVVFSVVVEGRYTAHVRSSPVMHDHVRPNNFWGDSDSDEDDAYGIYGCIYFQHVGDLFMEILKGAQSYTVTKHDA
jgi:hypothetical protein